MGADVTSIDPHFVNLFPNNNIAEHIFDKLVTLDADSRLIPGLAESWKAVDPTDLGVQAAQGREVPRRLGLHRRGRRVLDRPRRQDPEQPGPFTTYTKAIKEGPDRRSVHDPLQDRRRRIRCCRTTSARSTSSRRRRRPARRPTDFNSGKATIGTGPFKFVSFKRGDRVELARNDAYWGEKPAWAEGHVPHHPERPDARRGAARRATSTRSRTSRPPTSRSSRRTRAYQTSTKTSHRIIYLSPRPVPRSVAVRDRQGRQAARQEPAQGPARAPGDLEGDQPPRDRGSRDGRPRGAVRRTSCRRRCSATTPTLKPDAYDLNAREEAARRGRLSRRLRDDDPRPEQPLRQRRADRAGGRADAHARRHPDQGRDDADERLPRARAQARVQLRDARLGRLHRRGVVAAARAPRDLQPRQGLGRVRAGAATATRRWTICSTRRSRTSTTRAARS